MNDRTRIIRTYDEGAANFAGQYNPLNTPEVLPGLVERLPKLRALDIGCGSGRDAQWLAGQGFEVDACDPAEGMIREAEAQKGHPLVHYYQDSMPTLAQTRSKDQRYDVILLSATWMHIPPAQRAEAIDNILRLAKPGAVIFFSLRHGPSPADRPMYEVTAEELKRFADYHMAHFEYLPPNADKLGRGDVWWDNVALRTPKEFLDALGTIKGQMVQGRMSATYKPVLLLSVAEALRNGAPVHDVDAGTVEIPFRAVTEPWQRMYEESAGMGLHQTLRGAPTCPVPHLKNARLDPQRSILSVMRDNGPLRHVLDPSGQPIFTVTTGEDGELALRFPRRYASAIQHYQPLVCSGAGEAIRRFLEKREPESPDRVRSFVDLARASTGSEIALA